MALPNHGCWTIVAYRSTIEGRSLGSLDFQVRWFAESDPEKVRHAIRNESPHEYLNDAQETVRVELAEIFAVEKTTPVDSGEEVTGFVAGMDELADLLS